MSKAKALLLWVWGRSGLLRYVDGSRSIQNTKKYLCMFSVPRGGVEKTANEKQKNRKTETQPVAPVQLVTWKPTDAGT